MNGARKSTKFGLGLAIGIVAGTLAGIFYAPKSGKQNRKDFEKKLNELKKKFSEMEIEKRVKEIYGTVSEDAKEQYLTVTKEVMEKLTGLKDKLEEIDTQKYQKIVEKVLADLKQKGRPSPAVLNKLKKQLFVDWQSLFVAKKVKKAPVKRAKPRTRAKK